MAVETMEGQAKIEIIRERLDRARRAWRSVEVAGAALRGLVVVLAAFLAALALDNLLKLPGAVRLVFGLAFVAGAVYYLGVRVVYRLTRRLTDEMVAAHVERAYPELDNYLINAVLLQKAEFSDSVTQRMAASQLSEATRAVDAYDLSASRSRSGLRRWMLVAGGLCLATAVYGLMFSQYFSNALRRYAAPQKFIPPVSATILTVTPGNAERLQGESLVVEARVEGVLPPTAEIAFDDGQGGTARKPMPYEGGCFTYEFAGLQNNFGYRVSGGDFTSDRYAVVVRARPGIRAIKFTYAYPDYMRLPERSEAGQAGNISAPAGTRVRLEAAADKPLRSASLSIQYLDKDAADGGRWTTTPLRISNGTAAAGEIEVARSGRYRITVTDEAGISNQPALAQIVALPDDPPAARVVDPGKDVTADAAAKLPLIAEAKDDFSLQEMSFWIQRGADKAWERQWTRSYPPTARETREGTELDLKALGLGAGSVLSYYFQAGDGKPGRDAAAGRSRTYTVTILDAAAAKRKSEQALEALRGAIARLIAMQKKNLGATRETRGWAEAGPARAVSGAALAAERMNPLRAAEEEIYSSATQTVRAQADSAPAETLDALASIAAREIMQAVDQLDSAKNAREKALALPALDVAAATEQKIVELLEKLLSDPQAFAKERLAEPPKTKLDEKEEALRQDKLSAERMLAAVKEFIKEQNDVVKMTKQVKDKPAEDFTKGDEELLNKVSAAELKWAKQFQELATDLSKLPPQDFSLANQAKELNEIYTDVQKAADAAKMKAAEMAVPLEQGGLELAKSIETNIEKWLAETPDRTAWKMEDPTRDYDVPLADLPKELEDIMGDLMEQEKDLLDEAADATSGWLDSIDKGVGWGTADGPIADMSAKGVTGNVLPDSQEVGGRSGEGRTGKSSGQYVQDTATGKGGRNTPTRLTTDPFEAGVVKDTSAENPSGATGGGKMSGYGQEGLHGPLPPGARGELKRVAQLQQQLIDKAQSLDYGLRKYNYPRGSLPKTIELMQQIQSNFEKGDISTAGASVRVVLSNLSEVKDVVSRQKRLTRDNSAGLPKELRDEIAASAAEGVPPEYRELVNGYFRALSETGPGK